MKVLDQVRQTFPFWKHSQLLKNPKRITQSERRVGVVLTFTKMSQYIANAPKTSQFPIESNKPDIKIFNALNLLRSQICFSSAIALLGRINCTKRPNRSLSGEWVVELFNLNLG